MPRFDVTVVVEATYQMVVEAEDIHVAQVKAVESTMVADNNPEDIKVKIHTTKGVAS